LCFELLQMRLFLAFTAFAAVVTALSHPPGMVQASHQAPLLPRYEWLHVLGAGYQNVLADYYWIQETHQAGEASTWEEYRDVYDYARMTTQLDPKFRYAYVFGGAIVPYNLGQERWVNAAESTDLFERCFERFPDYVYVRILLAYNWSFFDKSYVRAARLLEETSKMPGAPNYLTALATRLYAQGGNIEAGMALAASLTEEAADPETRQAFARRTRELQLEADLQRVDRAAAAYNLRERHRPKDLAALVESKDLDTVPMDPFQGTLYLGADGRAHSTAFDHRLESYLK
jgi:hypothetical protein